MQKLFLVSSHTAIVASALSCGPQATSSCGYHAARRLSPHVAHGAS